MSTLTRAAPKLHITYEWWYACGTITSAHTEREESIRIIMKEEEEEERRKKRATNKSYTVHNTQYASKRFMYVNVCIALLLIFRFPFSKFIFSVGSLLFVVIHFIS